MNKSIRSLFLYGFLIADLLVFNSSTRAQGSKVDDISSENLLQVKVHRLIIDPKSEKPVVILADGNEKQALMIWIDYFEARAIYMERQGVDFKRPLTHDLLERLIQKTDSKINKVIITHVKENTYYAVIELDIDGSSVRIDARPSDSIVMALKFKTPIFVSKKLYKEMAVALEEQPDISEKYGLSIQNLTPDLSGYFSFESTTGVLVTDVRNGSGAEKDGVKNGDIFVSLEDQGVEDVISFRKNLVQGQAPIKAKIFRNRQFLIIQLYHLSEASG